MKTEAIAFPGASGHSKEAANPPGARPSVILVRGRSVQAAGTTTRVTIFGRTVPPGRPLLRSRSKTISPSVEPSGLRPPLLSPAGGTNLDGEG